MNKKLITVIIDGSADRGQEALEPLQSDPFGTPDTCPGLVVTERDLCAVHRAVVENQQPDHREQDQQMELPVSAEVPHKRAQSRRRCLSGTDADGFDFLFHFGDHSSLAARPSDARFAAGSVCGGRLALRDRIH